MSDQVVNDATQVIPGQPSASPPDTGQPAGSPPAPGAEDGVPPTPAAVPYDQDPKWIAARAAEKNLNSLLSDNGYETIEDLVESLQSGRNLEGMLGSRDLTQVIADAETLAKYNTHWADQDAATAAETQNPDDKITALEKTVKDLIAGRDQEKREATEKEQNVVALGSFKSEVNSFIAKDDTIPEEYRSFIAEFSGVDNRFNDIIDIADKTQIRAMMNDHVKKFRDIEQVIIQRYIDGKAKIIPMSSTTPVDPTPPKPKVKNIAEASVILKERLLEIKRKREAS